MGTAVGAAAGQGFTGGEDLMRWPWVKKALPPVDTSGVEEIKEELSKQIEETQRVVEMRRHYKRTNNYVEDWMTAWRGRRKT